MTTNHIERLSSALIRPGRVDVRCEFQLATKAQIKKLFITFYIDLPHLVITPPDQQQASANGGEKDKAYTAVTGIRKEGKLASAAEQCAAFAAVTDAETTSPQTTVTAEAQQDQDQQQQQQHVGASDTGGQSDVSSSSGDSPEEDLPMIRDIRPSHAAVVGTSAATLPSPDHVLIAPKAMPSVAGSRPTPEQCAALQQLAERFADPIPDGVISVAELQGYLMIYKKDPWGAVQNVKSLLRNVKRTSSAQQDGNQPS